MCATAALNTEESNWGRRGEGAAWVSLYINFHWVAAQGVPHCRPIFRAVKLISEVYVSCGRVHCKPKKLSASEKRPTFQLHFKQGSIFFVFLYIDVFSSLFYALLVSAK
jgi:hypothetical protein